MFKRVCITSCLLWLIPCLAYGQQYITKVFQQGLDGYDGCKDVTVSIETWADPPQRTSNFGRCNTLRTKLSGREVILIKYDLSSIPPNSEIKSAYLYLYNTTESNHNRNLKLYEMLVDWDEGNQCGSEIDRPGDHGATGEKSFDYYEGEGEDIFWGQPGMKAGVDYVKDPEDDTEVGSTGWYSWDITKLVKKWVNEGKPNYGVRIADSDPYNYPDWRYFYSSEYEDNPTLRPKLIVVYNPNAPFADAGSDQSYALWSIGDQIILDGTKSWDPNEDRASLMFNWRFLSKPPGSQLTDDDISPNNTIGADTPSFIPVSYTHLTLPTKA